MPTTSTYETLPDWRGRPPSSPIFRTATRPWSATAGRPLSAGEAQRIALARAFLRDARLVILDEPTANLDAVNAEAVTDAMSRLSEGRTLLVIAHRPELARHADRIVRLEAGRLVDDRGVVGA